MHLVTTLLSVSESTHVCPVTRLPSALPALPILHLSSSDETEWFVCSVPQLFCLMPMPGHRLFLPESNSGRDKERVRDVPAHCLLASLLGSKRSHCGSLPMPKPVSGHMTLRWNQDKDTCATHPELSPPSRAHKRHPRHLRLPHALFAAPAALLWMPCGPCPLTRTQQQGLSDWGNPPQDQNSMWKSKSWESKSPKLRELPRTGKGVLKG